MRHLALLELRVPRRLGALLLLGRRLGRPRLLLARLARARRARPRIRDGRARPLAGAHPLEDGRALRRLWQACDNAKRALSGTESVTVEVDGLAGDVDYELKLSR